MNQCNECPMSFRSEIQLKRHKEKFCIGSSEKDEEILNLRTSNDRVVDVAKDRIKQLEALKQRKLKQQEFEDQEDKQLLTSMSQAMKPSVNLSRKSPDLRQMQDQINKVMRYLKYSVSKLNFSHN